MKTTWPMAITSSSEIELRIGILQHLFISRNLEWKIAGMLAIIAQAAGLLLLTICLTTRNADLLWIMTSFVLMVSFALFGFAVWSRSKRQFFCFCQNGCAYGSSLSGPPQIAAWPDIREIWLEEDSSLNVEKRHILGITISATFEEVTHHWLRIESTGESIRLKLKELPEPERIIELLIEQTREREIKLDHSCLESPELQEAKYSPKADKRVGMTTYYAAGVIIILVLWGLKVAIKLFR